MIALVVSIPTLVLTVLIVSCIVYQNLKGGQEEGKKKNHPLVHPLPLMVLFPIESWKFC